MREILERLSQRWTAPSGFKPYIPPKRMKALSLILISPVLDEDKASRSNGPPVLDVRLRDNQTAQAVTIIKVCHTNGLK